MKQYRAMLSVQANWMDDERISVPSLTVFETDDGWRNTGLYNAAGTPLMTRTVMGPIGFVAAPEDGDGA